MSCLWAFEAKQWLLALAARVPMSSFSLQDWGFTGLSPGKQRARVAVGGRTPSLCTDEIYRRFKEVSVVVWQSCYGPAGLRVWTLLTRGTSHRSLHGTRSRAKTVPLQLQVMR